MGEKNKSKLTLADHINKLPYDIEKKIFKIVVKEEESVVKMARLLACCSKSARYELWADFMQRMPLGKFLYQIEYRNIQNIARELQESIGHRDDMTRWSYTNLSEADKQAIGCPLFSIIEAGPYTAFIFNERNLYEYCKRLPCSRSGFIPWGAFKLDIIHMILDYSVHHWRFGFMHFFSDIVARDSFYPIYLLFCSGGDYNIHIANNGTEIITGVCLERPQRAVSADGLNLEFYELMPAPIDYRYLWKAFEDRHHCRDLLKTNPSEKRPIYRTFRRKPEEYFSEDEKALKRIKTS